MRFVLWSSKIVLGPPRPPRGFDLSRPNSEFKALTCGSSWFEPQRKRSPTVLIDGIEIEIETSVRNRTDFVLPRHTDGETPIPAVLLVEAAIREA